jgi:WD40 repeat protein
VNDKTLEWVEFTNYIIELGMVRKDRNLIDAIKNYYADETIKDTKHDTEIENMYYLPKIQQMLVMEKDAKFFKVYDARNGKLKHTVPPKNLGNSGAFIAADYIDSLKLVATTSNNNAIDFWDAANY